MKIGYDAKRAFFNNSGLGNYSRGVIDIMAGQCPDNTYYLFTPKAGNRTGYRPPDNAVTVLPSSAFGKKFSSLWRSLRMGYDIHDRGIDLYHGLSHELPSDIRRSGARSAVTMHDLIYVHLPELYKPLDRYLYTRKYRKSCSLADRVIAISIQTKDDLVNLWNVPEEKIDVVYQGCDPMFYREADTVQKELVRKKYDLPENYMLSVGTIEERKNLLLTVRAMAEGKIDVPLVACGRHTPYADRIMDYAIRQGISNRVKMIHNVAFSDLPTVYRMAEVLIYASVYEGFGIPILEGLESGVPVITSRGGVFPETGGDAAYYVDPQSTEEMIGALNKTLYDTELRTTMTEKGYAYARRFRPERIGGELESVYTNLF